MQVTSIDRGEENELCKCVGKNIQKFLFYTPDFVINLKVLLQELDTKENLELIFKGAMLED